jgi:hypothetical protein
MFVIFNNNFLKYNAMVKRFLEGLQKFLIDYVQMTMNKSAEPD